MMRGVWSIVFACLLTACNTMHYVSIETYNPAEITFPEHVTNVLIVNNAAPQPPEFGCSYEFMGVLQDTCRAVADSAINMAGYSLGKAIVAGEYFNDVLFYNGQVRTDNNSLIDAKLSQQQVIDLCRANNADAIISFDRLLFKSSRVVSALSLGYYEGKIKVEVMGILRTYLPEKEIPLTTVLVNDSVFWNETASNLEILNLFLPSPEDALTIAASYVGGRAYPNFVPFWINDTRWYYSGVSASWKEAAAYIKADRWESASQLWEKNYNNSTKWKDRAKASSNLALCYEMLGKLEEAKTWAELSLKLFTDNSGKEEKSAALLKKYVEVLNTRIQADKKLNMQIGIE